MKIDLIRGIKSNEYFSDSVRSMYTFCNMLTVTTRGLFDSVCCAARDIVLLYLCVNL